MFNVWNWLVFYYYLYNKGNMCNRDDKYDKDTMFSL